MCDKCIDLDKKIGHYESLRSRITDTITLEGLAALIADLLAEKAGLHPDQPEEGD